MGRLDAQGIAQYSGSTPDWKVDGEKLRRTFVFRHFRAAMIFLNRVADLAESEGHHPDFCVHYNRVEFSIWTHAVGGLSENDFILAAKISDLELRTG